MLFLIEMLEPFLDPALTTSKNAIAFGDVSITSLEKQERDCALSLNFIRRAVHRQAVLSELESEWKRSNVAPRLVKNDSLFRLIFFAHFGILYALWSHLSLYEIAVFSSRF